MMDTYLMIAVAAVVPAVAFVGLMWYIARRMLRSHERLMRRTDDVSGARNTLVTVSSEPFEGTELDLERDEDHASEVMERLVEQPPNARR